ncbi:hypothetical protein [Flavobacterium denitrificans]|uniref:hypothetical protein n=1 Tax=Flavobacterium denitrificans TaxID=281361 RepID=UPI0004102AE7|nr:hypothetical protein [Flavobacterium denitrificans]
MALFRVKEILSGNKVRLEGWNWKESTGTDVVIAGYNPTQGEDTFATVNESLAKNRLISLIDQKEIELGRVVNLNEDGSITCVAFYNGVDISKYFPEYTQASHP